MSTANPVANRGPTRPARMGRLPARATAMTPSTGKPMAEMRNPAMALQVFPPAWAPKKGGKIRFPAPKNMEKRVSPTNKRSLPRSLFISLPLPSE